MVECKCVVSGLTLLTFGAYPKHMLQTQVEKFFTKTKNHLIKLNDLKISLTFIEII